MGEQGQEVGSNAVAIQSGGDTVVTVGMTPTEVQGIIHSAMVAAMPFFTAVAEAKAQERMGELEQRVMEKLASQPATSEEALKDPDFQYMLTRAHHSYARSGDSQIAETLVDLIAQRAAQPGRSRLSLSLNDAVDKTALLTKNEFAELSLVYTLRYMRRLTVNNFPSFLAFLKECVLPHIPDISEHASSYQYLQAHSCAHIEMGSFELRELLIRIYAGVLSKGFDQSAFEGAVPEQLRLLFGDRTLVIPCLHDPDKWQLNAMSKETYDPVADHLGFSKHDGDLLWNMFERTLLTDQELVDKVSFHLPSFRKLRDLWETTQLKNLSLTTVGIALGYANARRLGGIRADLSIWIK
jgi:hypothetical protein